MPPIIHIIAAACFTAGGIISYLLAGWFYPLERILLLAGAAILLWGAVRMFRQTAKRRRRVSHYQRLHELAQRHGPEVPRG
jgi:membrane protein implicated in regulation of membrane protease activity